MSEAAQRWEFWIDVGGTFTDCLARDAQGRTYRAKTLSSGVVRGTAHSGSSPEQILDPRRQDEPPNMWAGYRLTLVDDRGRAIEGLPVAASDGPRLKLAARAGTTIPPGQTYELTAGEPAPVLAVRQILRLPLDRPFPPMRIRLGTTRGTNALLTRTGAPIALITTRGLEDMPEIGEQDRPDLFALDIRKRLPLTAEVVGVDERVAADGQVLRPLDEADARATIRVLIGRGCQSLAICLMNAYANPAHERRIAAIARQEGIRHVSVSSEVSPLRKLVARMDTTLVDAYLNPVLDDYLTDLQRHFGPEAEMKVMTSAGGLVRAADFRGRDSILSGPAGGVVGVARVAEAAGYRQAIGLDMGGTSTDVCRYDGSLDTEYETIKAGVRLVTPSLAIETVAAGGGSICRFDGTRLLVGPESAGADPGPACYGRGGPLTLTDMNVFLGRIPADSFPFRLDREAAARQLQRLARHLGRLGLPYSRRALAEGFLQIAANHVAQAIRSISIAKGYDVRTYVLVAFGGAAGQLACAVADMLGIGQVLVDRHAGVLSALGLGHADVAVHRAMAVYEPLEPALGQRQEAIFEELERQATQWLTAQGFAPAQITLRRQLEMRYPGRQTPLHIDQPPDGDFGRAFTALHRKLFGYAEPKILPEVVAARVDGRGRASEAPLPADPLPPHRPPVDRRTPLAVRGSWRKVPCYQRTQLHDGAEILGPAVLLEEVATTVVEPGWSASVLSGGTIRLARHHTPPAAGVPASGDPVMLEVFNRHFAAIARQMGLTLQRTASSVNVKERLDFSCAIFTPRGDLVVNAPHIPVHLGAMGETVRCLLEDHPQLAPGDVLVTNDPYRGGSHLPDVTVVTPVFKAGTRELAFLTASRAHHAEIGGISPGSMPAESRVLAEEGVLIPGQKIVEQGRPRLEAIAELLREGPYPSRAVEDNLADLRAQIAANQQGVRDLLRLVERYSLPTVQAYMEHIQAAAERTTRAALAALPDGCFHFVDHLDDGWSIQVAVTIRGDAAEIDFNGTGPVHPGNLNANRAITTAAVLYVLRCLLDEDIPLNQGVLAPVRLILPEGLLAAPRAARPELSPAVAGGNVETSQRIVDVLLGALRLAAASQGTMNNLLFGDATFGYYETLCGGVGATPRGPGADAVHSHMTNTRLTDPEVLEARYPVRLRRFAIRRGSGGSGRFRGGDGVVRELEFLRPLEVTLVSQRRGPYPPYGLEGGGPGALGRHGLVGRDGALRTLAGTVRIRVEPGEILRIETPGGGGWGTATPDPNRSGPTGSQSP